MTVHFADGTSATGQISHNRVVYYTSSNTYTPFSGCKSIQVYAIGGGGGSGSVDGTDDSDNRASAGGGGAGACIGFYNFTGTFSAAIVIGGGGAGGTTTGNTSARNGGTGGATTFTPSGSFGGEGTLTANGGGGSLKTSQFGMNYNGFGGTGGLGSGGAGFRGEVGDRQSLVYVSNALQSYPGKGGFPAIRFGIYGVGGTGAFTNDPTVAGNAGYSGLVAIYEWF